MSHLSFANIVGFFSPFPFFILDTYIFIYICRSVCVPELFSPVSFQTSLSLDSVLSMSVLSRKITEYSRVMSTNPCRLPRSSPCIALCSTLNSTRPGHPQLHFFHFLKLPSTAWVFQFRGIAWRLSPSHKAIHLKEEPWVSYFWYVFPVIFGIQCLYMGKYVVYILQSYLILCSFYCFKQRAS